MRRFPPPPRQFSERIFFVGEATSGDGRTIGPLDCVIDHSRIGQHVVHGWILGNKTTQSLLDPFWNTPLQLRTKGNNGFGYLAEDIRLGGIGSFSMTGLVEPLGIVADFTCASFRTSFGIAEDASERASRQLTFSILGPKRYWHINHSMGYERDGSRKVHVYQPDVDLGELPFRVSVGPAFVHDKEDGRDLERSLTHPPA